MKQKFGYFLPSKLKKIPELTPARPYGVYKGHEQGLGGQPPQCAQP